jgi:type I restriction enzyme S subunit
MDSELQHKWRLAGGDSPDHWTFATIESLLANSKSIAVGVMYPGEHTRDGIPLIKVADIKNGLVTGIPEYLISKDKDFEYRRTKLQGDELLITLVGNPGDCVIVTEDMAGWNVARAVAVLRLNEPKLRAWVRYALLSPPAQHFLSSRFNTTVQKTLNLKDIRELFLPFPPERDRAEIASIIDTINNKIAVNRQMNTTLESMAQALFKSWFVDFDPVIDKALAAGNSIPEPLHARAEARKALGDQRKPLPITIQQQFPDRFVFTEEMGWVPAGWEVSTIGEQVDITGGGTPSTKNPDFWDDGVHAFCTPKDMSKLDSIVVTHTDRYLTDAGVQKITSGQLPSGVVLMSSRAPIGYLAISDIPVSVNQGIIAMLPSETYSAMFLLSWAHFNMGQITDRANGSTFMEISKRNFRPIPFLVPNSGILSAFNQQAKGIYSKLLAVSENAEEVTKLRDTLLPKLLSGELRVPEAEATVASTLAEESCN